MQSNQDPQRKLSDILAPAEDNFQGLWEQTEAASEFSPIPMGKYVARITRGGIHTAKSGSRSYQIEFTISEGEHTNRKVWLDLWLTQKALAVSKRELAKIGIDSPAKLNADLPAGYIATISVVQRTDDRGETRNEIRRFDVTGFKPPTPDDFAPGEQGAY